MERLQTRKWALPIAVLGGVAVGAGAVLGIYHVSRSPDTAQRVVRAFEKYYTDPGRCLHDTPYDPANGAFIDIRYDRQSSKEVLSDMPHAANSYRPSVLFFADNAYDEFIPSDYATEAFLGRLLCPELPQT